VRLGGSLEVSVGNVETVDGGRQVFGGVTRAQTDITASDPAYPGNRAPDRHHQGDRFHRRLSGSVHGSSTMPNDTVPRDRIGASSGGALT
jgi:hypothetical protein